MPGSIPRLPAAGSVTKDRWNAFSSFFARFRLTGWKRLCNEARF